MEHYTSAAPQSPLCAGLFSLLSGEAFSSRLRDLTLGAAHKEILGAIGNASIAEWQADASTGKVSLETPALSATFYPKASGEESWLVARTVHGEVTLPKNNSLSARLEQRLVERIAGYRAELTRGLSPSRLRELIDEVTNKSMNWTVERSAPERTPFGDGSYREQALTSYVTTTPSGFEVSVHRCRSLTFISFKDSYQENERYTRQLLRYDQEDTMSRVRPFPPFLPGIAYPAPRRPDPPLQYGTQRTISWEVHVHSPEVNRIASAFGLAQQPIASLRREESL